jgi:N-acetylglucosaminyldiphosphoundecaprenol N-acetyl-beta-D-mannosaminyltransferase
MNDLLVAPPSRGNIPSHNVLGVRVDALSMDQVVSSITSMVHSGKSHQVVTVNPEFIMLAQKNLEFRTAINNASLVVPDGIGIIYASRYLGKSIPDRVTGIDLTRRIAAVAAHRGLRLFLLGAAPGVADRAAAQLRKEYPSITIAGTYAGSPRVEEEEEICSRIGEAKPHILLVAYGAPNQELWICRNKEKLRVPVAIGVGGALDFLSGVVRRAPDAIQRAGFEWLFRLFQQPWRWRRMMALPVFAVLVLLKGSHAPKHEAS